MRTNDENPTKIQEILSERLKRAYNRVSPNLQKRARVAFCEFHEIADGTFRKKVSGHAKVTEQECEFMEAYRPKHEPA